MFIILKNVNNFLGKRFSESLFFLKPCIYAGYRCILALKSYGILPKTSLKLLRKKQRIKTFLYICIAFPRLVKK